MDLLCQQQRHVTSVSWPVEVDAKVSLLVRAAAAAGERTSRAELLAALVSTVEVDPQRLADLLHKYRRLPSDAFTADENRDDLPLVRRPGPRRMARPS
ncbi:hypothetical protein [Streptomyces hydrogenans]|uniref:hypothetical protein n=1 Tax=Streptomyces hydrogenans TaxID=1873719 RepID=UPI00333416F7